MSGALLYLLTHLIVDLHVKDIGNEVERILVVLNFGIETGQVETISEIVLIDFTEVFIST